ncbi:MAG: hypothetical protein JWQ11_988 [Rhizobacter sp.]|nr:hypothetical protein [Rhizobacter sp.]
MRTTVCPPSESNGPDRRSWMASVWFNNWLGTHWTSHPFEADSAIEVKPLSSRQARQLIEARDAFIGVLSDIETAAANEVVKRIRVARSMRELWHIRPQLFDQVALRFSQHEAERRLAPLNSRFPLRSSRSSFMPWAAD